MSKKFRPSWAWVICECIRGDHKLFGLLWFSANCSHNFFSGCRQSNNRAYDGSNAPRLEDGMLERLTGLELLSITSSFDRLRVMVSHKKT